MWGDAKIWPDMVFNVFQQYENEYINTIWNRIYILYMNIWYAILGYMTDIWQLQWISDTSYSSVWYDISPVYAMWTHLRTSEITIFLQTSALPTVPGNPSVRDALDKVARTGRAGPIYITRQLWKNGALFCCTTTCVAADFRGANLWKWLMRDSEFPTKEGSFIIVFNFSKKKSVSLRTLTWPHPGSGFSTRPETTRNIGRCNHDLPLHPSRTVRRRWSFWYPSYQQETLVGFGCFVGQVERLWNWHF